MKSKKQLREKFLSMRKIHDGNDYRLDSENIVQKTQEVIDSLDVNINHKIFEDKKQEFLDNKEFLDNNKSIGLYWPIRGEVDLMKMDIKSSIKITLPKIKGEEMYYVLYDRVSSKMERSIFNNLMQPQNENKIDPNVLVIPGLSISLQGDRLGFGSGYYDRYIEKIPVNKKVVKIGVCFHSYLSEYLPRETHDLVLDYIVTNKIIIKL